MPEPIPFPKASVPLDYSEITLLTLRDLRAFVFSELHAQGPLEAYVRNSFLFKDLSHFHPHYAEWRMRRVSKVLERLPEVSGLRILELGSGFGDIGAFFAALGAQVLSLEVRNENRHMANARFQGVKGFECRLWDVENDFSHFGHFDVIINFGMVEMVRDVDLLIDRCTKVSDNIFLETMVCDSLEEKIMHVELDANGGDNPITGISARPSPSYVERLFRDRGFNVDLCLDRDLNTSVHCYSWGHLDSSSAHQCLRRFWQFKNNAP